MEPGLRAGQWLLFRRLAPRRAPARGDVVVFELPNEDEHRLKRVIGVPGDRLKAEDGLLFLNGERLAEPYLLGAPSIPGLDERWELILGAAEYFVMGDNRVRSADSRRFGPVRREAIGGRALARVWPPSAIGGVG